jgi:hypothetical protein
VEAAARSRRSDAGNGANERAGLLRYLSGKQGASPHRPGLRYVLSRRVPAGSCDGRLFKKGFLVFSAGALSTKLAYPPGQTAEGDDD